MHVPGRIPSFVGTMRTCPFSVTLTGKLNTSWTIVRLFLVPWRRPLPTGFFCPFFELMTGRRFPVANRAAILTQVVTIAARHRYSS